MMLVDHAMPQYMGRYAKCQDKDRVGPASSRIAGFGGGETNEGVNVPRVPLIPYKVSTARVDLPGTGSCDLISNTERSIFKARANVPAAALDSAGKDPKK